MIKVTYVTDEDNITDAVSEWFAAISEVHNAVIHSVTFEQVK